MNERAFLIRFGGLLLILAVTVLFSLAAGERWLNPFSAIDVMDHTIVWQLRWPRLLTAFAVGGLLALAGAWFQVMLGNALAEPYVLGVAGSAAVGAVVVLAIFPESGFSMSFGAFIGALIGIGVVMFFARLGPGKLLLAGVVLAAFWSAVIALMLALLPQGKLGLALGWMLGDLSSSAVPVCLLLLLWALALACGMLLCRSLDRLLLGEAHAAALGVDIRRLRWLLLIAASSATAVAVTAAGTIGFIGLVIPHAMRLIFGSLHRFMLPASAIGGGILLMLADSGARSVIAPAELPVGVITAFIGVPVFLWLLWKKA
ncbi:MAG: iron chelate uptake ABC transporter family permease subunit [Mariprofundaceae bacterium]|nr:iron chelate uptake ABC transporter family permease subunit [Mariprofundaceae bacterium]